MKTILSIDGGGVRGVIPATILASLEKHTGIPIWKQFDMISGTSTGAIVALCLAKGIPAENVAQLYQLESKNIFNRGWARAAFDHFGLAESKYPAAGVESVLEKYLGIEPIGNSSPFLLIPTLNLSDGLPHFFKSGKDSEVLMSYAARCSSAAPTYFPPKDGYVDGGVFANDPSMCAYAEACKMWPNESLRMLSIGTGSAVRKTHAISGGLLSWATEITGILMNGAMESTAYQAKQIMDGNYLRVQEDLPACVDPAMDNTDPENITMLRNFALSLYSDYSKLIQAFVEFGNGKHAINTLKAVGA